MDTPTDEVGGVWGGLLEPVPPDLVSPRLSAPTRRFLTTVGLPTVPARDIVFIRDERLLAVTRHEGREFVVVAESDEPGYRFGVEVDTDRVFYLDDTPRYDRLVNSDLGLFVLFAGLFQRDVVDATGELGDAIAQVWGELKARDPEAAGDGDWWGVILDDIAAE
jgi:SUKH-4 immunity protein